MAGERIVFLSAYHDYRTAKRASIQQVADALAAAGNEVSFVSTRFSLLSKLTGDSRMFLWDRANKVETVNGVRCYLWRTALHPFASRSGALNRVMNLVYPVYARLSDPVVDAMFRTADHVIVEASVAAIYMRHIRSLNPDARIIYYATDRLDTVGAHQYIQRRLIRDADVVEHFCLRSSAMAEDFSWAGNRLYKAEFGVDPALYETTAGNPYRRQHNLVSVGSMLFDTGYFTAMGAAFPDIDFHVIGCGTTFDRPGNVHIHDEMPFRDTLPYIKYATAGVAPYRPAPGVEYLAESSLKLAQYQYFGLPAVCPTFAAGNNASRFGYEPGNIASMASATRAALEAVGHVESRDFLSWAEVADRVLWPARYSETRIGV